MTQRSLFDGPALTAADEPRLSTQLAAVKDLMLDGRFRTLEEIQRELRAQGIEAMLQGISARLRDLRKRRFGSHTVERRKRAPGLFEYRVKD